MKNKPGSDTFLGYHSPALSCRILFHNPSWPITIELIFLSEASYKALLENKKIW